MKIAMVGTRGVPARYGGFETAVEEIGARLASLGHQVVVYCRSDDEKPSEFRGMDLVHLASLRRRSLETLSHSFLSMVHVLKSRPDVVIVFNAANAGLLPLLRLRKIPVAVHVDGLEWKRSKWGSAGKKFYRISESLAVRWAQALIADARGIQEYYRDEFGIESVFIPYGAKITSENKPERVAELGLFPRRYHLVVARFEPENHLDVIVEGYVRSSAVEPLVVVGSAPYSDDYIEQVHKLADDRVLFLGSIWDQELLDQLYVNALTYLHGHSVGGTNPSLLRAMGAGVATSAFDVSFNREVLGKAGVFWSTPAEVEQRIEVAEANRDVTVERGRQARVEAGRYNWDTVAADYESLLKGLVTGERFRSPASGRRARTSSSDSR